MGDYSVTVNPEVVVEHYPVPRAEEVFSELAGCDKFSTLDMSDAFLQIELEESSKPILAINTIKGMFIWNRLPLGLASSPGIFQRRMEVILQDVPKTKPFVDDVMVAGRGLEHDENLNMALSKMQLNGLRLKRSKCSIGQDKIKYLGFVIDKDGLHNLPETIQAVSECPAPTDVQQLRAFLGFINQYSKFIPNLATIVAPLNNLLKSEVKWNWDLNCQNSFRKVKDAFLCSGVLVHYDDKLPLKLKCDASPYGVGAVLVHVFPNGEDRPIAFASRSLTAAEKGYAQFDREALGIVFGVKRFHQ